MDSTTRQQRGWAALAAALAALAACTAPTKPDGGQAGTTSSPPVTTGASTPPTTTFPPGPACIDYTSRGVAEHELPAGAPTLSLTGIAGARSSANAGAFWASADSTSRPSPDEPAPAVLALVRSTPAGVQVESVTIGTGKVAAGREVTNVDWEDLDVTKLLTGGPSRVYIADLGDRQSSGVLGVRESPPRIYWFSEPSVVRDRRTGAPSVPAAEVSFVTVSWPDGRRRNVEATFVDPATGDYYLVVANDVVADGVDVAGEVHRIPRAQLRDDGDADGGSAVPELVTRLVLDDTAPYSRAFERAEIMGAAISPDGRTLVLKSSRRWFFWERSSPEASDIAGMLSVGFPEEGCSPDGPVRAARIQPLVGTPIGLGGGAAIGFASDGTTLVTVLRSSPVLLRTYARA